MTRAVRRDPIYGHRRFTSEIIETCVRWYITYRLSYRDLVAMTAERDVIVSHTTIMRCVLRYVPEFEKRWARYARPVNSSWRMDETAVSVRGGRHYLYRAVDKRGKSIGSPLRPDRGMDAARRYWRYNYRFEGKPKPLALGVHPDVSLDRARARRQVARTLLADGVDPSARKRVLGNRVFAMPIGEAGDSVVPLDNQLIVVEYLDCLRREFR